MLLKARFHYTYIYKLKFAKYFSYEPIIQKVQRISSAYE